MIKITSTGWEDPNYSSTVNGIVIKNDTGLTGTFTNFSNGIHEWCFENNIEVDMVAMWHEDGKDYSRWVIKDEAHRTLFALRWT